MNAWGKTYDEEGTTSEPIVRGVRLPEAEAGNAEFQFAPGTFYLRGERFTNRREGGVEWPEKAAEQGHRVAKDALQQIKNLSRWLDWDTFPRRATASMAAGRRSKARGLR